MKNEEITYEAYIGNRGVKEIKEDDDGYATITLEDDQELKLKYSLYLLIRAGAKGHGNVTDNINAALGRQLLETLADYDLDCDDISRVVQATGTLAHNLREIKIGEAFECNSSGSIKLSKLLN